MKLKVALPAWALAVVLSVGMAVPAQAAEGSDTATLPEVAQDEVSEATSAQTIGDNVVAQANGVEVEIPLDVDAPIVMSTEGQTELQIGLPSTGGVEETSTENDSAAVVHEMADGTIVSPLLKSDGTVQILSILNSAEDPRTFAYQFDASAGATAVLQADGGALIVDDAGEEIASIAAPWAIDAAGRDVDTHFEAAGGLLTQVVQPTADATYPIVADPAVTATTYQYKYVSVVKTSNWVNKAKQIGVCQVIKGAGGGTCSITNNYSVSTSIQTSFGLSNSTVAANIGISATKTVSSTINWTSPKAPVGSSYKAWATGTRVTYKIQKWKVSKAGGITARTLISTSGTLTSFSPVVGITVGQ